MNNFLKGFFSLSIYPEPREPMKFEILSDAEAFKKDLEQVGADMYYVIGAIDEELKDSNLNGKD